MLERYRPAVVLGGLAGLMWAGSSCQNAETRPAMVGDCNDPGCIDGRGNPLPLPVGSGQAGAAGGGGAAGAAGAAGGGGMPDSSDGSLAGSVLEIADADLVTARALASRDGVELRAPSSRPSADDIVAAPAADGSFTLDGIERGTTVWVGVGSFEDPPGEPYIDTLQAVDSTRTSQRDLLVLRRDLMRELAAESFINNPVELDPLSAHLIVQFVDEDGTPVEGVQLTFPVPDQVSTAYDAGAIYSDALEQTSTRGTAVILNLSAPTYPGTALTIGATVDGELFTAPVQVARGAVTLVTAVVPD